MRSPHACSPSFFTARTSQQPPLPAVRPSLPPPHTPPAGIYKTLEGKGENSFAFDGKWLDRDTAVSIIASTHKQWQGIIDARTGVQAKKAPWLPPVSGWAPQATADGITSAAAAV